MDKKSDKDRRFSLGVQDDTGQRYISIPVRNSLIDYDEYYALSEGEYQWLMREPHEARSFADACRQRQHDDRLILKPGRDRGEPW